MTATADISLRLRRLPPLLIQQLYCLTLRRFLCRVVCGLFYTHQIACVSQRTARYCGGHRFRSLEAMAVAWGDSLPVLNAGRNVLVCDGAVGNATVFSVDLKTGAVDWASSVIYWTSVQLLVTPSREFVVGVTHSTGFSSNISLVCLDSISGQIAYEHSFDLPVGWKFADSAVTANAIIVLHYDFNVLSIPVVMSVFDVATGYPLFNTSALPTNRQSARLFVPPGGGYAVVATHGETAYRMSYHSLWLISCDSGQVQWQFAAVDNITDIYATDHSVLLFNGIFSLSHPTMTIMALAVSS